MAPKAIGSLLCVQTSHFFYQYGPRSIVSQGAEIAVPSSLDQLAQSERGLVL